jgi:tRNA pseudouridine55 synthase
MGRRKKGNKVNGWVVIDKPLNVTSTQVVGRVRRVFNAQKVGHAGTLDPLATGVLPVALGEATKTVPFMVDAAKTYRFTVAWGAATTTDDLEGEVTDRSDLRPTEEDIVAVLPRFRGSIEQIPPAFSALKVEGKRAYDLARRGEKVVLKPRRVTIDILKLLEIPDLGHATFEVTCSKGTYVRSLARDLAQELGTFGHVAVLRRLKVGKFHESDAISLAKLEELGNSAPAFEHLLGLETALDDIPALAVTQAEAACIVQGQAIEVAGKACQTADGQHLLSRETPYDPCLVMVDRGSGLTPVALGRISQGAFKPSRVFNLDDR